MVVDVERSSGDISPIDKVITTSHRIVQRVPKASCTYSAGMRHVKRMAAAFRMKETALANGVCEAGNKLAASACFFEFCLSAYQASERGFAWLS